MSGPRPHHSGEVQGLASVVIPCFNQSDYLREALASVAAQTFPRVESIVVDDGSTDSTSAAAYACGATEIVRQSNGGLARARNAGLARARGEFVVFLDADDQLEPDAITTGIAVLERESSVDAVARNCLLVDRSGRPMQTDRPPIDAGDLYGTLLLQNFIWTPGAVVFRRAAVTAIGGFRDVDAAAAADYGLYLRLARAGRLAYDDVVVVRYRQHDANMSRDPVLMLTDTLKVVGRERPHVPPRYRAALARGTRAWRAFYGEQIIHDLRAELRGRRRFSTLAAGALMVARLWPDGLVGHLWTKVRRIVRAMPPTELEPSRFHRSRGARDTGC